MVGTRLDPSVWNLGVPVALLTACGPIIAVGDTDTGTASASDSDTDVTTTPSTTTPSTTSPSTTSPSTTTPTGCVVDEDCPPNYRCDAGTCYYYGCADGSCCYDEGCCAEFGCYNDCFYSTDCPPANRCQYGVCYTIEAEAICESVPFGIDFEIPMPSGVNSLAFIQSDGNAERELLIGGSGLVLARVDGTTEVIDPEPYVVDLEVRDLDGDGDEDIVMADANTGAPRVLFRDTGWTPQALPNAGYTERVAIADLGGDGRPEVVSASSGDSSYAWQYDGVGGWETSYLYNASYFVNTGSFDGDTFEDILYSGFGVFATYGGFTANSTQLYNGTNGGLQIGVVDNFDAQGDDDVIVTEAGNGGVVATSWLSPVLQGNGWLSKWWPNQIDVMVAADINGDGFADVFGGGGGKITIAYGGAEPDGIVCVSTIETPYTPYVIAAGDMSGDGRLDLALSDGATAYVMLRTD